MFSYFCVVRIIIACPIGLRTSNPSNSTSPSLFLNGLCLLHHEKKHIFCALRFIYLFILALNGRYLTALIINRVCVLVTQTYFVSIYRRSTSQEIPLHKNVWTHTACKQTLVQKWFIRGRTRPHFIESKFWFSFRIDRFQSARKNIWK